MSFYLPKKDTQAISLDGMADLLARHYLEHAKWPCAKETVELAAVSGYTGDIKVAIDRALDSVQAAIRTWEEYHDPEKRIRWVDMVGERQVAKDEARAERFVAMMERETTYPRSEDMFGWILSRILKGSPE